MKTYNFKLYQISNLDTDYAFMPWPYAKYNGFDLEDYDCVCTGTYPAEDHNGLLESLFAVFNMGTNPDGVRGMSVSDIVEVDGEKYYCDSYGWQAI